MKNEFKEQLLLFQNVINDELKKYIKVDKNAPEKLLRESMNYSLLAGGKRLRPILMINSYKLFKDDIEKCMPYAVAIEMIHNFSLIHDDLPCIDNDNFRHSKPTNHKVYGDSTALLAGDALLNMAYIVMSEALKKDNTKYGIDAFLEISKATDKMILGEYVDVDSEQKDISMETLRYMHKNKTGALIEASVKVGAILSGADYEEIEKLSKYANNIGLAFQIKDDILSEIGNEDELGKPVGNDKIKKKSTYITKCGLERSKVILKDLITEAKEIIKEYNNCEFLYNIAVYIENRTK